MSAQVSASVFIATSLDGFIAREDGAIDWLVGADASAAGEDYGFDAYFASVDALVMGRNTWELVRTFDSWQYGAKPVVVLTSRAIEIPPERRATVSATSGEPAEIAGAPRRAGAAPPVRGRRPDRAGVPRRGARQAADPDAHPGAARTRHSPLR